MDTEKAFAFLGMHPNYEEATSRVDDLFEPHYVSLLDDVISCQKELIDADCYGAALNDVESMRRRSSDATSQRLAYLGLVQKYLVGLARGVAGSDDWFQLGEWFRSIEDVTPEVSFYRLLYAFRCYAKAEGNLTVMIEETLEAAAQSSKKLDDLERYAGMGDLQAEAARWFLSNHRRIEAFERWQDAACCRWNHFFQLCRRYGEYPLTKRIEGPNEEEANAAILKSARQAQKMRTDFPSLFPARMLEDCGITDAAHATLAKTIDMLSLPAPA